MNGTSNTMTMNKVAVRANSLVKIFLSAELRTELLRKAIHFTIALVPFLAQYNRAATFWLLATGVLFYTYAESVRMAGREIPIVTKITSSAARSRDRGKFVLGPVTLGIGAMIALVMYPSPAATIGIYALAFGDGFASLAGKFFGTVKIPHTGGKSVEGSLACLVAVFISTYTVTRKIGTSLIIAVTATILEAFPLKDMDNILIPAVVGLVATFLV